MTTMIQIIFLALNKNLVKFSGCESRAMMMEIILPLMQQRNLTYSNSELINFLFRMKWVSYHLKTTIQIFRQQYELMKILDGKKWNGFLLYRSTQLLYNLGKLIAVIFVMRVTRPMSACLGVICACA